MFETIDIILLLLIRLDDSALITTFGPLKFHSLLHSETRRADYRKNARERIFFFDLRTRRVFKRRNAHNWNAI